VSTIALAIIGLVLMILDAALGGMLTQRGSRHKALGKNKPTDRAAWSLQGRKNGSLGWVNIVKM